MSCVHLSAKLFMLKYDVHQVALKDSAPEWCQWDQHLRQGALCPYNDSIEKFSMKIEYV